MYEKIKTLIDEFLENNPELFLVDFKISSDGKIQIFIDSDDSLVLQDCLNLSRHIEPKIEEEMENFSLDVSSPGLDVPLKLARQFVKNQGREVEINTTENQTFKGILSVIDANLIKLEWQERVNKEIGKGKINITLSKEFNLEQIKKAVVVLKF